MRNAKPHEIADGVHWLRLGLIAGNIYFVSSGASWVLIDTAFKGRGRLIQRNAEALYGVSARPAAIFLTHIHPDHSGSALELAKQWGCPVYVHPDEMPLAVDRRLATVEKFANPMDHWIVLPILRLIPRRRVTALLEKESLEGVVQALDPDGAVPGMSEWMSISTPGHSPGHIVFFRKRDRVLISGDALLTVDLGSFRGFLSWLFRPSTPRLSGPPWYTNWSQQKAKSSAVALAHLQPTVVASGHGVPMMGEQTDRSLPTSPTRP